MAVACLAASLTLGTAASVHADDDLKDKKSKVDRQVEQAHEDLDHSSKALQKANGRLTKAKSELADAQAHLADVREDLSAAREEHRIAQDQLEQAETDLAEAEDELAQGEQAVADQREQVSATVADTYQLGDPDMLALGSILQAESLDDIVRADQARETMMDEEKASYDDLRTAEIGLQVNQQEVERLRDAKSEKEDEAAAHLTDMQDLTDQATDAKAEVARLVGERRDAQDGARQARDADKRKLAKLEREQAKLAQQLKNRAAQLAKQGKNVDVPSGGYLGYPINGAVTSPFGYRKHPIYGYWGLHDGIDFGGGCGLPIHAAADGRVMQSTWSDVYGNRMVVDHGLVSGKGLATIYNHATRYTVSVGQQVSKGQVIGYTGSTGWSTGCHLHFTVMENGKAVNPLNWM